MRTLVRFWQWRWLLPALAAGLLLALVPSLDIAVSGFFYSPEAGFYLREHPLALLLYHGETPLAATAVGSLLVALLLSLAPGATRFRRHRRAVLYLLLVLVVGPGLIVNVGLKNHWDRARPKQVDLFGGQRQFTPALVPGDQCARNCSFVSGHAALGYSLLAVGFVAVRRRRWWLTAGVLVGTALGAARILQGGHFLSDVVFAYCVVFVTAWILHALMCRAALAGHH